MSVIGACNRKWDPKRTRLNISHLHALLSQAPSGSRTKGPLTSLHHWDPAAQRLTCSTSYHSSATIHKKEDCGSESGLHAIGAEVVQAASKVHADGDWGMPRMRSVGLRIDNGQWFTRGWGIWIVSLLPHSTIPQYKRHFIEIGCQGPPPTTQVKSNEANDSQLSWRLSFSTVEARRISEMSEFGSCERMTKYEYDIPGREKPFCNPTTIISAYRHHIFLKTARQCARVGGCDGDMRGHLLG